MKKILIIILISFGFLTFNYFGMLNWLKGGLSLAMGWRDNLYSSLISGQDDPGLLSDQLGQCQAELVSLKEENIQVRRLLGAQVRPETRFELAKILSLGNQELIIFLDNSEEIENQASVVSGPFLVGKIDEIYGKNAKVNLLLSTKTKLPVKIWSTQDILESETNLVGEGILSSDGQNLYVKEILDKQPVVPGNWVGAVIETGDIFWIGKIEEVFPTEDKVFQEVRLSWSVDLSKLITLGVIK